MEYFNKINKRILEQEIIICPFCNCGFVNKEEHRPLINCPACNGYAKFAIKADREVKTIQKNLDKYSIKQIEQFIKKLCGGLYRSEFRTHLNNRVYDQRNLLILKR